MKIKEEKKLPKRVRVSKGQAITKKDNTVSSENCKTCYYCHFIKLVKVIFVFLRTWSF